MQIHSQIRLSGSLLTIRRMCECIYRANARDRVSLAYEVGMAYTVERVCIGRMQIFRKETHMKKRLISAILTAALLFTSLFTLTSCKNNSQTDSSTSNTPTQSTINIASLKGPTSIGLVKLYSDSDNNETTNKYNYSIHGTADEISTGLIKGDIDIAAIPCNLASILYNKTEGNVLIAGINTLGVLYIVEKNCDINNVSDLKGMTIYSTGQGTTPEYTLRYLLNENGIDPDTDVTIKYSQEASEVVAAISTKDSAVAMLPQPYVTVAMNSVENLKVALDVTGEWEKLDSESTIVTGVIVIRKAFAEENPDAVNSFIREYRESTDFANNNVDECAELLEQFDIFKAAIAKKAIPECNVTLITEESMKNKVLSYLKVLYDANPASVGGTLPDENIFYIAD